MKINKKLLSSTLALAVSLGVGSTVFADDYKVQFNEVYDTPSYIIENWEAPEGLTKKEIVLAYIENKSEEFKLLKSNTNVSFEIKSEKADQETETHHFRVDQKYKGIPVYGSDQTITLDENNNVTS